MAIERRGDRYRVRVRMRGRRVSATFDTRPDAAAYESAWIAAVERDERPPDAPRAPRPVPLPTGRRVVDVVRAFGVGASAGAVRDRSGRLYKPATLRRMEGAARVWVVPKIGAVDVRDLTRGDVQAFVDEVAAEGSAESARKALVALRVALRAPLERGDMASDPSVGVRPPTEPQKSSVRILTDEERRAIMAALEADDEAQERSLGAPLYWLLLGSGLRIGEALALPWGEEGLDLGAGVARVRRSLDRVRDRDGRYPLLEPKTAAAVRDVPLAPSDVARLRRHRLASGRRDGDLVFAEPDGSPLGATGRPTHAWRRALKAAKTPTPLPRIHDCRHMWAVDALRAGLSYREVAKIGGWSSTKIVHDRYGRHTGADELVDVGARLEAARAARGLG